MFVFAPNFIFSLSLKSPSFDFGIVDSAQTQNTTQKERIWIHEIIMCRMWGLILIKPRGMM